MARLHYFYDPQCGWCYGIAPLIVPVVTKPIDPRDTLVTPVELETVQVLLEAVRVKSSPPWLPPKVNDG
jgi:protein-disulfide isomerase-like protein with CxxC motif